MFERSLFAGWGDMDFNGHMSNTAFLYKSGDMRTLHFVHASTTAAMNALSTSCLCQTAL
jgi:hypothetical protein